MRVLGEICLLVSLVATGYAAFLSVGCGTAGAGRGDGSPCALHSLDSYL